MSERVPPDDAGHGARPAAAGQPEGPVPEDTRRTRNPAANALLLVTFVFMLWIPFYRRDTPRLFGFPFFYWYQFLWVGLGVVITGIVYKLTTESDDRRR